jgi:hypothetical protein
MIGLKKFMKTVQPIPLRNAVTLVLILVLMSAGVIGLMAWFSGL